MDYKKFKFTKDHEWLNLQEDLATVGITDYAQSQLGDIVFVEMPELSAKLTASESFGAIEAVKTVADLFAPVSIEVSPNISPGPSANTTSSPASITHAVPSSTRNIDSPTSPS